MDMSDSVPSGNGDTDHISDEKSSIKSASPPTLESPKAQEIRDACQSVDIEALISLAISDDGFLHDDLRKSAWPILLGSSNETDSGEWKTLPVHKDEEQVALDVNRSFVYYPNGKFKILCQTHTSLPDEAHCR
jgi:hypothetical protein